MNTRNASPSAAKVPALVMLAAVLAAGCASGETATGDASAATKKAPAAAPAATPVAGPVEANPLPKKIHNDPNVRSNIVQTKCAAVPGGWGAAGTAANPGKKPVTYRIVVYFTTTKATTLDYARTQVKVPAGKTVPWSAKKKFDAEDKMLCPMPGISLVT
ncbi:hypothetical protein ACFYSC_16810 [Streptosporangium sp. NPDC004379]|uniref:hypothetical protein n=1 Tax=Streptosporangium sp. NPDC004379 TaxID=3366189 RepID=UPI0036B48E39